jgi:ribosomal protein S18 acetylase RimI-like enzyme
MQKVPRLIITRAKVSDAQAIRNLEHAVWHEEVVNKYDSPMFVRFGYVYIARFGGKLVGAIISYKTNKNEIYVCDLVVDAKYRRLKIGEKLYRKLLRDVRGTNVVSFLDPNLTPTNKLHEKLGGKVVARIKDPYNLAKDKGLESGARFFVRIKN